MGTGNRFRNGNGWEREPVPERNRELDLGTGFDQFGSARETISNRKSGATQTLQIMSYM